MARIVCGLFPSNPIRNSAAFLTKPLANNESIYCHNNNNNVIILRQITVNIYSILSSIGQSCSE